ncbi:DUF6975 family protein [Sphingomonas gilva]|nr:hypothetical protein [Sphingomonas gilva]
MAGGPMQHRQGDGGWSALAGLVAADGASAHTHAAALTRSFTADPRDLADAVHHLCLLHGRHPGVIDHAGLHTVHDGARGWLIDAAEGFASERGVLTRLVVAAGPMPSTPNHAEAESAITTQRHALDMLSQSDRNGCAIGAAFALALDWAAIRDVLAEAARRFGVDMPESALPPAFETAIVAATVGEAPAIERAMLFGAQQLIAQHRGLWDLLEARAEARRLG